jgi:PAS domain S-box-containing protein
MSAHTFDSPVGRNFPENALEVSEEQADPAAFILRGSRFLFANPAMEELSGYNGTELVGMSIFELLHSSSRENWWQSVKQLCPERSNSVSVDVLFTTKHKLKRQVNIELHLENDGNEYTIVGAVTSQIQYETHGTSVRALHRPEYRKRFAVKLGDRILIVPVEEIEYVRAAGSHVEFHVRKEIYLSRASITCTESMLNPSEFMRIHRSIIVNLSFVHQITPLDSGDFNVRLKAGEALTLSRSYRSHLNRLF